MKRSALVATILVLALDAASASIPIESFFRDADIREAALSPSGRWLAMITTAKTGRSFLAVVDVDDPDAKPTFTANDRELDVEAFHWVGDDRMTIDVYNASRPPERQPNEIGRYLVDRDGSNRHGSDGHAVIARPIDADHVVVIRKASVSNTRELRFIYAMRLDLDTNEARALPVPNGRVVRLVFDPKGEPRVAVTNERGSSEVLWREVGSDAWTRLARSPEAELPFIPLAVDASDQLYVAGRSADGTYDLRRYDVKAGRLDDEPLLKAAGFDVPDDVIMDRTGRVVGAHYTSDAEGTVWFDPAYRALQAMVDARFPGRVNRLSCRRCSEGGALLVLSYSDQDPGTFWLYRSKDASWRSLGKVRADIDPNAMAQLDLFRIRARDGLEIPVWVTTPPGPSATPRPAVVLAHGGPWIRGVGWGWNPVSQFLASRGYVVLEPEFRGSVGYGFELHRQGWKQWGLKMQDDLVDAVRWAAARGTIDANRVCIAGGSYGGYATLMGLARSPDLYRCGVAWMAITDPRLMYEYTYENDTQRDAQLYSMPAMIGDLDADAALLRDASAVDQAAKIRAPVLLAAGLRDRRAPIRHTRLMRSALKAAGHDPEYVLYEDEGHGFWKVDDRVDFFARVEKFLAQNLQP